MMTSIYLTARRNPKRAVQMIIDCMKNRKMKADLLPSSIRERLRARYSVSFALGEFGTENLKPGWPDNDRKNPE